MNAKFTLAIIALVGIGVFALPSTMALFAGQHSFYNIDATGNQVPCQKCHGDVKAELTANAASVPKTPGPHAAFQCEYCHRIEAGYASGDNGFGLITYRNVSANVSRYLAIPIIDYEAKNYPTTINGTDTINSSNASYIVTSTGQVITKLEGANGGAMSPTNPAVGTFDPYRQRLTKTYDSNTGEPLDQVASTRYTGLNLKNANISVTGVVNLNNSGSKSVNPGTAYHAASLVSCMECHGGEEPYGHYSRVVEGSVAVTPCSDCHYGGGGAQPGGARWAELAAGGFGLTSAASDTGNSEAHNAWVKTQGVSKFGNNPDNGKPAANNDACVACHTHVAVDINFKKGYLLQFDAIETSNGTYSVGNFAVVGHVNVSIYGNGSGQTFATGEKTYDWTPGQTLYINGNGSQVVGLGTGGQSDTTDNATALTTP